MDAQSPSREVAAVAEVIRLHLLQHPQASDTAEGIQRWWVLPRLGEVSLQLVETSLALLEAEGVIQRLQQAWAPTAYLAARHLGEGRRPTDH
jgi:hypothetical protein